MTHSAIPTASAADQTSLGPATASDISQHPTFQAFLKVAQELGTEDALLAKSARRDRLLKLLRPIDYLTRTGVAVRAGALALAWSPLICAAPFIYSRFGLNAVVYDSLLPASLFTAMLFWAVKTLQKSPWTRIEQDTKYAVELEQTVSQGDEARQLRDAILRLRSSLYLADLKLLAAYNQKRQSDCRSFTAGLGPTTRAATTQRQRPPEGGLP